MWWIEAFRKRLLRISMFWRQRSSAIWLSGHRRAPRVQTWRRERRGELGVSPGTPCSGAAGSSWSRSKTTRGFLFQQAVVERVPVVVPAGAEADELWQDKPGNHRDGTYTPSVIATRCARRAASSITS